MATEVVVTPGSPEPLRYSGVEISPDGVVLLTLREGVDQRVYALHPVFARNMGRSLLAAGEAALAGKRDADPWTAAR